MYLVTDQVIITSEQDVLDLIGETEFQDLVVHDYNFSPAFFDLSTITLGHVLQKLTNYHVRLAIIGKFSEYPSTALRDFIRESNKQRKYLFVDSLEEVKKVWHIE